MSHPNSVFELISNFPLVNGSELYENTEDQGNTYLHLKGQMKFISNWDSCIYLASPV